MKKIIVLLFILISLVSCEKKLKNGQILYDHKAITLHEYVAIVNECQYGKIPGGYHFFAYFKELLSEETMYFEFFISDEFGLVDILDSGLYTIEANISISISNGAVYAYPIIKYSKKGNKYEKIMTIEN